MRLNIVVSSLCIDNTFYVCKTWEAIMCRSWYVFLLITGTERARRTVHGKEIGGKYKMAWLGPNSRSFNKIDLSVVHLYLFGTEHAMIL